jgi:hypothetical protein
VKFLRLAAIFVTAALAPLSAHAFQSSTATALTISPTKVVTGSSATLTAAVTRTSGSGTPSGKVVFSSEGHDLGSASLNGSGIATFQGSSDGIALGAYPIIATYTGDSSDSSSTSPAVYVSVQSATTTAFNFAPSSVQQNQPAVLTATVTRTGNPGTATGTVTFLYGSQEAGYAQLKNGTAQLIVNAAVPLGSYNLTAHYNGDTADQASTSSALTANVTPAVDVLTHRNNVARTGVQSAESVLNLSNVNSNSFGKVFSFTTDGYAFAQPLYVSNYTMNDGNKHNVLFVETSGGSIYAFDADNNNPSVGYLWHVSVIPSGEDVVTPSDYGCGNPSPSSTILGTPVIDRTLGVLYVIGKTKLVSGNSTTYTQRLHAINLADGTEKLNGPTVIAAAVPGTGDGTSNGTVSFDPLKQSERAAMLEANGSVWISWASHCDIPPYHGWTIGYNAANISQQTAIYNNTPNGSDGGIWMTAAGPAADNQGHIFTVTGNGTFDVNTGGADYGDSVQRFDIGSNSLTPADYFVPSNQLYLSDHDLDVGTVDGILFEDPASGVAPHLIVTGDKTGRVYLMNRYNLGGYDQGSNGVDGLNADLEDFAAGGSLFASFGYFNGRLYIGANNSPLAAYDYAPGSATTAGSLPTTPSMSTTHSFCNCGSGGGVQPVFSASGPDASATNAIAWGLDISGSNGVLYAFNANSLSTQLYSSSTNNSRDQAPPSVKFTLPVVANGRVYVAGQGVVAAYGLLPQ